jgi:hypothetical protein
MTKRPRDKVARVSLQEGLSKDALIDKVSEIACTYGRGRDREEYVNIKKLSRDERMRAYWSDDDYIFLEQNIEEECARLSLEWGDELERVVNGLIREFAEEEEDEGE